MKKISFVTMFAIAVIAFPSCSKLAEKLTVDVPVEASIDLDIPAGGGSLKSGGKIFYSSESYNTATDENILKYKDRIKSIAATGGKLKLSLPSNITSITLTNTAIQIRDVDTGALIVWWDFESKTYDNNAELTLSTPKGGSLKDFSSKLDSGANLMFEFTGNSGNYNEAWNAVLLVEMTVKAQVIG